MPAGARTAAAAALGLAATSGVAQGAALERAVPQVVRLFYEEGTYGEFGLLFIDPHQSGEGQFLPTRSWAVFVPGNTGDLFQSHTNYFAALKGDIGERMSYVIGFDQPHGVATHYRQGSFPSPQLSYAGTMGRLNAYQLTGVLAYDVTDRIKLYAGLRAERLDAKAAFRSWRIFRGGDELGLWLLSARLTRPEIALRVGLTYSSAIDHDLDATEERELHAGGQHFSVDMPQSVKLDFQTGVAPKTLVFGSIRWVDWADFEIAPPLFV